MREIDTETPVVWPAWCYSGEAAMEDATPQQASSPHQTQTTIHNNSNSIINNNRGKRKNLSPALISGSTPSSSISSLSTALNQSALSSIDKMLNDRMMAASAHNNNNNSNNNNNNNIDNNNKKFCDNGNNVLNNNNNNSSSNNNLFYEVIKQEDCLDLNVKMNGDLTNNINSNNNNNNNNSSNNSNSNLVKNERLSPSNNNNNHNLNHFNTNGEQTSASRSRSATPSSYPGTPPQGLNNIELQNSLNMQQQTAGSQRPEIAGRNYSDFMRSLAAKYNNQNDSSNAKNLFFDPRLNITQLKSATKETFPTTPETKKQQQSTNAAAVAAVANAAQHLTNMSSLFSGLPFPPGVFTPPIIDMSSTQALITLARAAKEAEIQSILKGSNPSLLKRNSSSVNSSNINLSPRNVSPNTQNHLGTPKIPNFQMNPGFSLANFHQQMSNISNSTATSPSNNHNTSNNNNSSNNTLNDSNSSNNGIENLTTIPLDLSSSTPVSKKSRLDDTACRMTVSPVLSTKSNSSETKPYLGGGGTSSSSQNQLHAAASPSPSLAGRRCQAQSEEINSWSVEQVCEFVSSIDICAEYVQNFRDQQIDGTGLPLLTEEHLTNSLGLKLGPALKLKSILAKKLGGPCPCVSCVTTGLNNSSSCSNHSGGAIKKEYSTNSISSIVNHSPWPSCAESES